MSGNENLHLTTIWSCLAVTALVVVIGTTALAQNVEVTLENVNWRLLELNGRRVEDPGLGERPHLSFEGAESRVSGSTGCNNLTAGYETGEGNQLTFGPVAATRRYCAETAALEREFLAALELTTSFRLGDGRLELLADDVLAILVASDPE